MSATILVTINGVERDLASLSIQELALLSQATQQQKPLTRQQEKERAEAAAIAEAPMHLVHMASDAGLLSSILHEFIGAVEREDRTAAMAAYHREFFSALNAFQSHSTKARISKPFFLAEVATDEEKAEYERKQQETAARRATKKAAHEAGAEAGV
jgi:hypothetical protein